MDTVRGTRSGQQDDALRVPPASKYVVVWHLGAGRGTHEVYSEVYTSIQQGLLYHTPGIVVRQLIPQYSTLRRTVSDTELSSRTQCRNARPLISDIHQDTRAVLRTGTPRSARPPREDTACTVLYHARPMRCWTLRRYSTVRVQLSKACRRRGGGHLGQRHRRSECVIMPTGLGLGLGLGGKPSDEGLCVNLTKRHRHRHRETRDENREVPGFLCTRDRTYTEQWADG